jgi:signal transduction histidine kinase/FixJ family two-component response regulator
MQSGNFPSSRLRGEPIDTSVAQGIRPRILVPVALAIVVLLGSFLFVYVRDTRDRRDEDIARAAALFDDMLQLQSAENVALLRSVMELLLRNPTLEDALVRRDREKLLEVAEPMFRDLRSRNGITHFYFILPDRTMLLRVQHPEEWGDRIDRLVLQEAQRTRRPAWANEQGPFGSLTLRVVHPWIRDGEVVGYLELGKEFEDVVQSFHELLGVDVFVVADKHLFDRRKWESMKRKVGHAVEWDEFPNVLVLSRTAAAIPAPIAEYLRSVRREHVKRAFETTADGRDLQAFVVPFADIRGRELGELVVLRDVTAAQSAERRSVAAVAGVCTLIGGSLIAFFYVLLGRVQVDVAERTERWTEAERVLAREHAERQRAERERDVERERVALLEEQSRMAAELATAKDAAEAASRAKSSFLANMSHEMRTPLNVILGFARLIGRQRGLPPDVQEDLGILLRSGEHLHTLIDQVLDLTKIEAGRATVSESAFDLGAMLDELEDMFGYTAQDKGLELTVDRAAGLPRRLRGDPLKLRQVLINLLSNAVKFTTRGGVTLSVGVRSAEAPAEPRLSFRLADTGCGIAPEELDEICSPFVQAQAGRQAREGAGLGLAISRHFVALMGGELRVESAVGRGTVVSFDLPLREADGRPDAVGADARGRRVVGLASGQPRFRILVADDRWASRHLVVRLLAPLGFELAEAGDGEEAVQIWERWQPHLILMDLRMPVLDGWQATRRIKASPRGRSTPIIALTASSFEEERADVLAAGCDDFLRKPFHEDDLLELLSKHLGVVFVHEDEPAASRAASLPRSSLAALSPGLRTALGRAVTRLDPDAIDRAIGAIRDRDPRLADALSGLATRFRYEDLLDLVRDAEEPSASPGEA